MCCFGLIYYVHFQFCDPQPICYLVTWFHGDLWVFSHHLGLTIWGFGVVLHTCEDGWHLWLSSCKDKFFNSLQRRKKGYTRSMRASAASAKVERGRVKLQHHQNTLVYYPSPHATKVMLGPSTFFSTICHSRILPWGLMFLMNLHPHSRRL